MRTARVSEAAGRRDEARRAKWKRAVGIAWGLSRLLNEGIQKGILPLLARAFF
jgi:hypothetical protein